MFHFPSFPPHALYIQARVTALTDGRVPPFGHPRITARLAAPRGLSRPTTSFIGSWCQGIHRAPLKTWPQRCSHPLFRSQTPTSSPQGNPHHQPAPHPPKEASALRYGRGQEARRSQPTTRPREGPDVSTGLRNDNRPGTSEDEQGRGCVLRTQQRVIRHPPHRPSREARLKPEAARAPDDCDVPPMSAGVPTNGAPTGQPCEPPANRTGPQGPGPDPH